MGVLKKWEAGKIWGNYSEMLNILQSEKALREKAKKKWAEPSNAKYGRWQFGLPSSPFPHGNVEEQIYFGWQSHLIILEGL